MDEDLLTTEEVAALFGIKPATLAHWRYRGEGPAYVRLVGRRSPIVRYRREDVDRWIASHVVAPA